MKLGNTEAIAGNLFFLLMIPAVLFVGCSLDGNMPRGADEAINNKIVDAGDYSMEGNDGGIDDNASDVITADSFLGVEGMTPADLKAEEFWGANDVEKLIEQYDSIEIVSSSYEDGATKPLYTNNYWYSKEYSANKNEPGDSFIIKDNVRAVSRPNYMNSDNKEETGIMIELYSSPDGRIANGTDDGKHRPGHGKDKHDHKTQFVAGKIPAQLSHGFPEILGFLDRAHSTRPSSHSSGTSSG